MAGDFKPGNKDKEGNAYSMFLIVFPVHAPDVSATCP